MIFALSSATRSIYVCAVALLVALPACTPLNNEPCPAEDPDSSVAVGGVYRYSGGGMNELTGVSFGISGTITFEQSDGMVRVTDTTYDFAGLRRLESQPAAMQGNCLRLALVPKNGDEDYRADVQFVFSEDGERFCVGYADTNRDMGPLGSFRGVKQDD